MDRTKDCRLQNLHNAHFHEQTNGVQQKGRHCYNDYITIADFFFFSVTIADEKAMTLLYRDHNPGYGMLLIYNPVIYNKLLST